MSGLVLAEVVGPWTFSVVALGVAGIPFVALVVRRQLKIVAGGVTVELEGIRQKVDGIDKAVNGRPHGDPVLYDVAMKAANETAALRVDMSAIAEHVVEARKLSGEAAIVAGRTEQALADHLAGLRAVDKAAREGRIDRRNP